MNRFLILLYGLFAYLLFFITILYAIGFVTGLVVPKDINDGAVGPVGRAVLINVGLLGVFAIQHIIMARPWFKRWWTKIIPAAAERSTFVVAASAILLVLFWAWRPIPEVIWQVEQPILSGLLTGISILGFGIVFYSSFLIDHFDLFGVRQVVLHARKIEYTHRPFAERSLYRFVRHPLMVGFLIAFWATPTMTAGHMLFATVTTCYIFFGVVLEERDLVRHLGDDYLAYRSRTPAYVPFLKRAEAPSPHVTRPSAGAA